MTESSKSNIEALAKTYDEGNYQFIIEYYEKNSIGIDINYEDFYHMIIDSYFSLNLYEPAIKIIKKRLIFLKRNKANIEVQYKYLEVLSWIFQNTEKFFYQYAVILYYKKKGG